MTGITTVGLCLDNKRGGASSSVSLSSSSLFTTTLSSSSSSSSSDSLFDIRLIGTQRLMAGKSFGCSL
eukprot:CAMPEP_0171013734 /NCGR_PEP_ID=MMETSP0736-20130129/24568_1 /TAXON_ID=186038 /ORGANISM="Fragilariopsis kerguelensis, Strain L26-C5" /LENGTH=67 /DNA_ID=CAMNT_0011447545 /DNA_START=83 /DNA_END=282 /DNA_ORIENTATION=-